MRSMLEVVVRLCRLASTRCPVSAAVSASVMVSGSRISPMSSTSGSSRSASRRPVGKSETSLPICRWRTRPAPSPPMLYSTGSSSVMSRHARRRTTSVASAASVALLPEPVGPQTRTRPCGAPTRSLERHRKVELAERRRRARQDANGGGETAGGAIEVEAEAAGAVEREPGVDGAATVERGLGARAEPPEERVEADRRTRGHGAQAAVDAQGGRVARQEVHVAGAERDRFGEDAGDLARQRRSGCGERRRSQRRWRDGSGLRRRRDRQPTDRARGDRRGGDRRNCDGHGGHRRRRSLAQRHVEGERLARPAPLERDREAGAARVGRIRHLETPLVAQPCLAATVEQRPDEVAQHLVRRRRNRQPDRRPARQDARRLVGSETQLVRPMLLEDTEEAIDAGHVPS